MTVRELIQILAEYPMDMDVYRFMGGTDLLNNLPVTNVVLDETYGPNRKKKVNGVILS